MKIERWIQRLFPKLYWRHKLKPWKICNSPLLIVNILGGNEAIRTMKYDHTKPYVVDTLKALNKLTNGLAKKYGKEYWK